MLDILETLSLQCVEEETVADLFEIAPRLRQVSLDVENTQFCPKLPWHQLRLLICIRLDIEDISYITSLMQRLSHPQAAFEIRRFYPARAAAPQLPPAVMSTTSSFLVEALPYANVALGDIFSCLTLPYLRKLLVVRQPRSKGSIPWPAPYFESLSLRSSFRNTLRVLELPHVAITEDDLLRTLDSLASLECLVISDQPQFDTFPERVLVTDILLLRLTQLPHPVPKLKTFICTSLYQFSAVIYFDFIVSRIVTGEELFQCMLQHFPKIAYEFDPDVHQKLLELVDRRKLEFSIGEVSPE